MRHRRAFAVVIAIAASSAALTGCISTSTRHAIRAAESAPEVEEHTATPAKKAEKPKAHVAPPTDAALASSVDLPSLEAAALARHPMLVAKAYQVRALAEKARAEGSLPAPELMAQIWQIPLAEPYRIDKAGMVMVTLRQQFPAAGVLDFAAEASALEAQRAAAEVAAAARSLLRDVDRAFADYVETNAHHETHVAHRLLIEQMGAAARARYATGGSLSDFTKADLEVARLEAEIARWQGAIDQAKARINGLLARPTDAPLGPPRAEPPMTVSAKATELAARAAKQNPEVTAADFGEKAAERAADAADRADSVPSFNVGLSYFHPVAGMPVGWGASVGMSLPWFWGAASSRTDSAEQRVLAERAAANATRVEVTSEVARALAAVNAATSRYLILRDRTRPAAGRALDASRAGYAAGGTDILAWLDAERVALEVELATIAARGDLDRALADLDRAAGEHVARTPLPSSASKEADNGR